MAGRFVAALDRCQRRHRRLGFPLAVIYKFADDQGPYLTALITYYGFLSLFPLLLLLVTILGFVRAALRVSWPWRPPREPQEGSARLRPRSLPPRRGDLACPSASGWRAAGRRGPRLRARVTRSSSRPPARPDPLTVLERQAATLVPELVPIRYSRMLVSPFTFYRGAAMIMAR